jgi:hypothetical protein
MFASLKEFPMKSLITVVLLSTLPLFAQEPTSMGPTDRPQEYQAKGGLFSVCLIPGDKETKLIVVGNEVAKLKVDKLHITATMKFGKDERVVQFQRFNDYYIDDGNMFEPVGVCKMQQDVADA